MTSGKEGGTPTSREMGPCDYGAHPVFAYLLGEGDLEGHSFGDGHAPPGPGGYKRSFWWRTHLRAALEAKRFPAWQPLNPSIELGYYAVRRSDDPDIQALQRRMGFTEIRKLVEFISRVLIASCNPPPDALPIEAEGLSAGGEQVLASSPATPSDPIRDALVEALAPFAGIVLSSLYSDGDSEGYKVFLEQSPFRDFSRQDVLRARAALSLSKAGR